jgi:hypothetical protein
MDFYQDYKDDDLNILLEYRVYDELSLSFPPDEHDLNQYNQEIESRLIAIVFKQAEINSIQDIHYVIDFLLDNLISLKSIAFYFENDIKAHDEALYEALEKVIFETHTMLNLYNLYERMIAFKDDTGCRMPHLDEKLQYKLCTDPFHFPTDIDITPGNLYDLVSGCIGQYLGEIIEHQDEIRTTFHIEKVLAFLITNFITLKGFDLLFGERLLNANEILYGDYQAIADRHEKLINLYHMYKTYCRGRALTG